MPHTQRRIPTSRHYHLGAAVAIAAIAALPGSARAQIDVNVGLTPTALTFGLSGIAWQLTPSTGVTVNGIQTWFSGAAGGADRPVTFEIRSDPNGPALRSVTFNSAVARQGLGGAAFEPITLVGGTGYWLTFLDIQGLGRNVDEAAPAGATILPVRIRPPGAAAFITAPIAGSAPILRLTTTTVPEPSTVALVGVGLATIAWGARRRRA